MPQQRIYDHIPWYTELVWGVPSGLTLHLVPVTELFTAQQEGVNFNYFHPEPEESDVFRIVGPKGECDVKLGASGTPIPGQSSEAGARDYVVSDTIYTLTGHTNPESPGVGLAVKEGTRALSAKPQEQEEEGRQEGLLNLSTLSAPVEG